MIMWSREVICKGPEGADGPPQVLYRNLTLLSFQFICYRFLYMNVSSLIHAVIFLYFFFKYVMHHNFTKGFPSSVWSTRLFSGRHHVKVSHSILGGFVFESFVTFFRNSLKKLISLGLINCFQECGWKGSQNCFSIHAQIRLGFEFITPSFQTWLAICMRLWSPVSTGMDDGDRAAVMTKAWVVDELIGIWDSEWDYGPDCLKNLKK